VKNTFTLLVYYLLKSINPLLTKLMLRRWLDIGWKALGKRLSFGKKRIVPGTVTTLFRKCKKGPPRVRLKAVFVSSPETCQPEVIVIKKGYFSKGQLTVYPN